MVMKSYSVLYEHSITSFYFYYFIMTLISQIYIIFSKFYIF